MEALVAVEVVVDEEAVIAVVLGVAEVVVVEDLAEEVVVAAVEVSFNK